MKLLVEAGFFFAHVTNSFVFPFLASFKYDDIKVFNSEFYPTDKRRLIDVYQATTALLNQVP